ncbi:MAG: hypothetical protein P4L31_08550 [Candidatus Babeliales bacterium]|nr:hypothetical protein [Candidatus Babeliales bacterium]
MKYTQIKIGLLSVVLLLSSANVVAAAKPATKSVKAEVVVPEAVAAQAADERSSRDEDEDEDHCPPLRIANLCAKNIKAKSVATKKLCSHKLHTDHLTAEHATVTQKLCANDLRAPKACLGDLTAQNICSNGLVKVADFQQCGKYRATAVFDDVETYTLGCNLNFDVVIDDPNGNYTAPAVDDPADCGRVSYYTAPLSGYYIITVQIDQQNLVPFDGNPILGVPVGNLHIDVNGLVVREAYFPYLSFLNQQQATVSGLVSLKAGDQVSSHYEVFALSQTAGFISVAGTVDVAGSGNQDDSSLIKIHYLSSDCIDLPCGGCDFTCESRHDEPCPKLECNPCCHRD